MLARLPELKRATFLALTATATPEVQRDIVAALALPDIRRVIADFDRPNLHFETFHIDDRESKDKRLLDLLSRDDGAAIVYASTRKEAATVHQYPKLFSFAPEAQRILAGGGTTGEFVVIAFAPRMGRRTRTRRKEIL